MSGLQLGLFDVKASERGRDIGIAQAKSHADARRRAWSDGAYSLLQQFIIRHEQFQNEELRIWAHDVMKFDKPPDPRSWGAIVLRGVREGLIEKSGYAQTKHRDSHAKVMTVWRRVEVNKEIQ